LLRLSFEALARLWTLSDGSSTTWHLLVVRQRFPPKVRRAAPRRNSISCTFIGCSLSLPEVGQSEPWTTPRARQDLPDLVPQCSRVSRAQREKSRTLRWIWRTWAQCQDGSYIVSMGYVDDVGLRVRRHGQRPWPSARSAGKEVFRLQYKIPPLTHMCCHTVRGGTNARSGTGVVL
jgi:hypothetical protein